MSNRSKTGWALVESLLSIAMPAISLMLLGRLLGVEAYGYFGVAFAYVAPVQILVETFFFDYLLLRRDDEAGLQRKMCAAHGISILAGLVCALILFLFAPILIPGEYGHAIWPMRTLALTVVFSGFSAVPQSVLFKQGEFKTLAQRTIVARLLALVVGGLMAWRGLGVWALVAIQLLNGFASLVAVRLASSRWPTPTLDWLALKDSWRMLWQLNLTIALSMYGKRLFLMGVAKQTNIEMVGHLEMTMRISEMLNSVFSGLARRVALPIYMKPGSNSVEASMQYWRLTMVTNLISLPIFVALVIQGPWLLSVAISHKWEEAGVILQFLAFATGLGGLRYYTFDIVNMQQKTWVNLVSTAFTFVLLAGAGYWFDVSSSFGLGMVWVWITVASTVINYVLIFLAQSLSSWAGAFRVGALCVGALLGGAGLAWLPKISGGALHPLVWLMFGGLTFVVLSILFALPELRQLQSFVLNRRSGSGLARSGEGA